MKQAILSCGNKWFKWKKSLSVSAESKCFQLITLLYSIVQLWSTCLNDGFLLQSPMSYRKLLCICTANLSSILRPALKSLHNYTPNHLAITSVYRQQGRVICDILLGTWPYGPQTMGLLPYLIWRQPCNGDLISARQWYLHLALPQCFLFLRKWMDQYIRKQPVSNEVC